MADHVFRRVFYGNIVGQAEKYADIYSASFSLLPDGWNFLNGCESIANLWRISLKLSRKTKGIKEHGTTRDFLSNVNAIRDISYSVRKCVCKIQKHFEVQRESVQIHVELDQTALFRQYNKLIRPRSWIEGENLRRAQGKRRKCTFCTFCRSRTWRTRWSGFLPPDDDVVLDELPQTTCEVSFFLRSPVRVTFSADYSWSALIVLWWIKRINELTAPRRYAKSISICLREHLGTPPRLSHSEHASKSAKWSPRLTSDLRIPVALNMITLTGQSHSTFRKLPLLKIKPS